MDNELVEKITNGIFKRKSVTYVADIEDMLLFDDSKALALNNKNGKRRRKKSLWLQSGNHSIHFFLYKNEKFKIWNLRMGTRNRIRSLNE